MTIKLTDLSVLRKLTKLERLTLRGNQISDITPIAENAGISGEIHLSNNPLNNTSYASYIPILIERGITVEYNEPPVDMIKMSDSGFETSLRQTINISTEALTPSNTSGLIDLDLTNVGIIDLDVEALKAFTNLKTSKPNQQPTEP